MVKKTLLGFIAGIVITTLIGYFVFIVPLHDVHTADAKRASELTALANKYKTDAATAKADDDATHAALDRANSRLRDIIGTVGNAQGTSGKLAIGLVGDLDLARQIDSGLQALIK